jgi:hypothetical protein
MHTVTLSRRHTFPLALLVCARIGLGQTDVTVRPVFYTWTKPAETWHSEASDPGRISGMIRVFVKDLPSETASDVSSLMYELRSNPNHPLQANRACILLQNYGDHAWGGATMLRDSADRLVLALNPDQLPFPNMAEADASLCGISGNWMACHPEQFQPWMDVGRSRVKGWMDAFCSSLHTAVLANPSSLVMPSRFHFDSEVSLTTTGSANFPFLLYCMRNDSQNRWSAPVPGSNGASLQQLWQLACQQYGPQFTLIEPSVHPDQEDASPWDVDAGPQIWMGTLNAAGFQKKRQRDLYLWFAPIMQRAVDFAMHDTAYSTIHTHFGATCLTSNYNDVDIPRTEDLPGAFQKASEWAWDLVSPTNELTEATFSRAPTRSIATGVSDSETHGALHFVLSSGRWLQMQGTKSSGDFGSPVLYRYGAFSSLADTRLRATDGDVLNSDAYRQWDMNRKPLAATGKPPREDWWQASRRNHRNILDSAVIGCLQNGKYDPATMSPNLAPWIFMPLSRTQDEAPVYIKRENTAAQLGDLRERNIREVLTFDGYGTDPSAGGRTHGLLQVLYHEVYDPYIAAVSKIFAQSDPVPVDSIGRLEDCVPRLQGGRWMPFELPLKSKWIPATISGSSIPYHNMTGISIDFANVKPNSGLRLTIRATLDRAVNPDSDPDSPEFSDIPVGRLQMANASGVWIDMPVSAETELANQLSCVDDLGTTAGVSYLYWTPGEVSLNPLGDPQMSHTLRRTFEWEASFASQFIVNETVRLRMCNHTLSPFTIRLDVVQLAYVTGVSSANVASASPVGSSADLNLDNVVDESDVQTFISGVVDNAPIADMNADDVIDGSDVEQFIQAFVEGATP